MKPRPGDVFCVYNRTLDRRALRRSGTFESPFCAKNARHRSKALHRRACRCLQQTQKYKPALLILPAFSWIITKRRKEILLAKPVGLCYNH